MGIQEKRVKGLFHGKLHAELFDIAEWISTYTQKSKKYK